MHLTKYTWMVSNSRSKILRGGIKENRGPGSANLGYRDAFDPSEISPGYPFRYGSPYILSLPLGL